VNGQIVTALQIQHRLPDFRVGGFLIDRCRFPVGDQDFDENGVLEFAGAFNPLWLIRSGELIETPASRFPIGQDQDRVKVFTNHEINIQPGDTIYMFSDGYADQFGGAEGKKLKVGKFKEVILGMQNFDMETQKHKLNEFIEEWKGDRSQIDDILVLGRKFE